MKFKAFCGLAATLFATTTAIAADTNADIYSCNFRGTDDMLLPDQILLARSDADGSYRVADPILRYYADDGDGDNALVDVLRENNKMVSLSWNYTIINNKGTQAKVLVNFSLQKKRNRAQIASKIPGYLNHDTARGTCTKRRGNV